MNSITDRRGIAPIIFVLAAFVVAVGVAALLLTRQVDAPAAPLAGTPEVPGSQPPATQGMPVPGSDVPETVVTEESPAQEASGTTEVSPVSPPPVTEHTVRYTNDGFSPSTIEIRQGETVKFMNDSLRNVWVASDEHPTHTAYPEFDALRGYAPGETYSFTFTRIGSWEYHDHRSARYGGTVVVIP